MTDCIISKVFPQYNSQLCSEASHSLTLNLQQADGSISQINGLADIEVYDNSNSDLLKLSIELKPPFHKSIFRSSSWACINQTTLHSQAHGQKKDDFIHSYNSVTKSIFTVCFAIAINFRIST